ncbi:MAG TPA: Fe-S cluster assembly protein SufD [Rhizomicrobium sp.]|jgi:Fe-S cluster assembly protein SufD|nr:Fe-S cluster assembly protein SufD [Rhizomicrobium sp.]
MNALPHRRIEDWKYSDLRSAVDADVVAAAPTAVWTVASSSGAADIADLPAIMPRGEHGAMAELAVSHAKTGPYLRVAKGARGAVHLHLTESGHGRALIVLDDDASLTLQETVQAVDFANVAIEIVVGKNARLDHVRLGTRNDAVQVADYSVRVAEGGIYHAHFANFGGKLSRTELHIALDGEGAQAHLSGVSVLNDRHADVTTHVDHAIGNTQSTQIFKNVANGHSRGVYQGKVTVRAGANGSDSRQTAKGLLLSEGAEIDLKPELEILADDVKCAHGAAVGDLDEESIFYLRSRGIPEAEARSLLIRAFLEDGVAEIEDEAIRASVWKAVEAALAP